VGFGAFGDEPPSDVMRVVANNAHLLYNEERKAALAAGLAPPEPRASIDWPAFLRANYAPPETGVVPAPGVDPSVTTFNAVWLRFLLYSEDDSAEGAPTKVLHALFAALSSVDHVLAHLKSVPPPLADRFGKMQLDSAILSSSSSSLAKDELKSLPLWSCPRGSFLPLVSMRRARIEDHDDLVPVFDAQSEVLSSIYGEFFLASLIQAQNAHQAALVAEVQGRARGLVGTTDQVDVRLLQKCFQLEAYEQLRKQKTAEEEAEEASGPTPLTRLHNVWLTMASNAAPLSQQEKDKIAAAAAAKRSSTVVTKRASMGVNALAGVAGLLKSEPAAAASTVATPQGSSVAATPASSMLSPPGASRALDYPSDPSAAPAAP